MCYWVYSFEAWQEFGEKKKRGERKRKKQKGGKERAWNDK